MASTPTIPEPHEQEHRARLAEWLANQHGTYRCVSCSFSGESAEQLAGHYRVTRCSPERREVAS